MTMGGRNATAGRRRRGSGLPSKVHRFVTSERFLHWALAIPFIVLYASALLMLLFWGEPQPRHVRALAAWIHKIAGIGLVVLPPLVLLGGWREWRVHLANVREAWTWRASDVRWLLLSPLAAVDRRIRLPEQGRFNAGEKLNFMWVCATYPLYIVTGLLIWMPGAALIPWVIHLTMAALGVVPVVGHIYLATVNPSTRAGLEGMITGWVDREWAKHHYRRWFRQRFERGPAAITFPSLPATLRQPAEIRCATCGETKWFASWEQLLQRVFQVRPLFCATCEREMVPAVGQGAPELAHAVLQQLRAASGAQEGGAADGFELRHDPNRVMRGAPRAQATLWRPLMLEASPEIAHAFPIYVRQHALHALDDHLRAAGSQGTVGFLIGDLWADPVTQECWIEIQRVLRLAHAVDRDKTAPAVGGVWERLQGEAERTGSRLLGWYHGQPSGDAELRPADAETHRQYFSEPWQVFLVTVTGEPAQLGAFYRPNGLSLEATGILPFLEVADRDTVAPEGKQRTRVRWKNYRPEAWHVPDRAAGVTGVSQAIAVPTSAGQGGFRGDLFRRPGSHPKRPA